MKAFTIDDIALIPADISTVISRKDVKVGPILWSAPMDTVTHSIAAKNLWLSGHNPVVSRFISDHEISKAIQWTNEHATETRPVFFAVGLRDERMTRLFQQEELNLNKFGIAIDVANGVTVLALESIKKWKQVGFNKIMSGSICTKGQAIACAKAGATHLRIGIGPGAACTTRLNTGVGVPNAYAVSQISTAIRDHFPYITLIADGGVRYPGDIVKYLVLGADGVMLGSMLSKAGDTPGWKARDGKLYKTYRGQASAEFQQDQYSKINDCPEGVSLQEFTWKGESINSIVKRIEGGIRSACTYLNCNHTSKLYSQKFIEITSSAAIESQPHGLTTRY